MTDQSVGHTLWLDLTVDDADAICDFYKAVIGWSDTPVSMGEYDDYVMSTQSEAPTKSAEDARCIGGICHAKGPNADIPAVWMNYFGVADLDQSLAAVDRLGGARRSEIKSMGKSRYCIIADPAGAVCALYENNAG